MDHLSICFSWLSWQKYWNLLYLSVTRWQPGFYLCRLIGDVLLCTGFLSYLGPFNQDFRILLNKRWSKELRDRRIPFTQSLNIVDMLVAPTTVCVFCLGCLLNTYTEVRSLPLFVDVLQEKDITMQSKMLHLRVSFYRKGHHVSKTDDTVGNSHGWFWTFYLQCRCVPWHGTLSVSLFTEQFA